MREFDKNQKVAIVTLGCVAIFIFFGAAWQFKTRLEKPFDYGGKEKNTKITFGCESGNCENDISSLMTNEPATASGTPIADSELEIPDRLKNSAALAVSSSTFSGATTSTINLQNLNSTDEEKLQNLLSGQGDAASLRSLMLEGGADPEMLKQISDKELLKIYQESLSQGVASSTNSGN